MESVLIKYRVRNQQLARVREGVTYFNKHKEEIGRLLSDELRASRYPNSWFEKSDKHGLKNVKSSIDVLVPGFRGTALAQWSVTGN